ncbi:MAG: nicotinate-nucleotide adenylyltransferase [Nitrospirae bacterium]|nr:MAG: nicotinate-nucleotide adenylyltransferase [Nitrospirota bacterium]
MRLGIFGGTFNPIHYGHLKAAGEARRKCRLDKIIFVPSGNPPLKSHDIAEAGHRYRMAAIAAEEGRFEVSDVETARSDKSYTVDTLNRLLRLHQKDELFFMLGTDAFLDLPNWKQPDKIVSLIDLIIVTRPGFDISDINKSPYLSEAARSGKKKQEHFELALRGGRTAQVIRVTPYDISSTVIRKRIKDKKTLRGLVPPKVAAYIKQNGLYL